MTKIGEDAFSLCGSLTTIHIPDGVTEIGNEAFYICTSLTTITIPDSVREIGYEAFSECKKLNSIKIPDSVTKIDGRAFRECDNLTIIVKKGSYAMQYCIENELKYICHLNFFSYITSHLPILRKVSNLLKRRK